MYKKLALGSIRRLSDGATIPPDPANTDYATYLRDVSAGVTVLDEDPVDPKPSLLAQIAALEATQHRAIREHVCGDLSALGRIKGIDNAIKAIRERLV